jgi:hypothetical protein
LATGTLGHLAGYLTLLAVLKEACDLPLLRVMEPNALGAYAESVPVDVALDLGRRRTAVMLAERQGAPTKAGAREDDVLGTVWPLALRDLSQP